jgi:hypothetical protein
MRKLKDVFVDTNLAKNFCNPVDPELKEFIRWLFYQGALVVSNKIIAEYDDSCRGATSRSSILVIIAHQTRKNRLAKISNAQLKAVPFSKAELRVIRCNRKDHHHLKAVLLSRRKMALTGDKDFTYDVKNLPCIRGFAARRPQDLPYRAKM